MARPSDEARRRMRAAAQRALAVASNDLLGRAQRIVPLDEGTLAASGTADVEAVGDRIDATVSFNTPYAAYQHERLDLIHPNGRQAKYLEGPLTEMTPRYEKLIADEVRKAL